MASSISVESQRTNSQQNNQVGFSKLLDRLRDMIRREYLPAYQDYFRANRDLSLSSVVECRPGSSAKKLIVNGLDFLVQLKESQDVEAGCDLIVIDDICSQISKNFKCKEINDDIFYLLSFLNEAIEHIFKESRCDHTKNSLVKVFDQILDWHRNDLINSECAPSFIRSTFRNLVYLTVKRYIDLDLVLFASPLKVYGLLDKLQHDEIKLQKQAKTLFRAEDNKWDVSARSGWLEEIQESSILAYWFQHREEISIRFHDAISKVPNEEKKRYMRQASKYYRTTLLELGGDPEIIDDVLKTGNKDKLRVVRANFDRRSAIQEAENTIRSFEYFLQMGQVKDLEDMCSRLETLLQKVSDPRYKKLLNFMKGQLFIKVSNYKEAERFLNESLNIDSKDEDNCYYNAGAYEALARINEHLSHYQEALLCIKKAEDVIQENGLEDQVPNYPTKGFILLHLSQNNQAKQFFIGYRNRIKDLRNRYDCIVAMLNLGVFHVAQSEWQDALKCFKSSLDEAKNQEYVESSLLAKIHSNIGCCFLKARNYVGAEDHLKKAIQEWGCCQGKISGEDEWLISSFEDQASTYYMLIDALVGQKSVEKIEEAFVVADRSKAIALTDSLVQKLNENERSFSKSFSWIDDYRPQFKAMQNLVDDYNCTALHYSFSFTREGVFYIWSMDPSGSLKFHERTWSSEYPLNFMKLFSDFELYQKGITTENELSSSATLLGAGISSYYRPSSQADTVVGENSAVSLEEFTGSSSSQVEESSSSNMNLANHEQFHQRSSETLESLDNKGCPEKVCYENFIQPVEQLLAEANTSRIVVVADTQLSLLPFEQFSSCIEKGDILGQYSICHVPSLEIMSLLGKLEFDRQKMRENSPLVIVGNRHGEKRLTDDSAIQEICENIRTYKKVNLDDNSLIDKLRLPTRFIHFNVHASDTGSFDLFSHYMGCVKLLEPEFLELSEEEDPNLRHPGYFYADQIDDCMLNTRLIFLNGCVTGGGNEMKEGIIGLARACLRAGASAVIATRREVDSKEAYAVGGFFYKYWVGDKLDMAHALKKAISTAIELSNAPERANRTKGDYFLMGLPEKALSDEGSKEEL